MDDELDEATADVFRDDCIQPTRSAPSPTTQNACARSNRCLNKLGLTVMCLGSGVRRCSHHQEIWGRQANILITSMREVRKGKMGSPKISLWKTRLVECGFPDRSFDIEFWQEQGDEAIFAAAREMVELAEETIHGRKPRELLQLLNE